MGERRVAGPPSGSSRPSGDEPSARSAPSSRTEPVPSASSQAGASPSGEPSEAQKRRARTVAALVFLVAIGLWTLGTSAQIVQQAMYPAVVPSSAASCAEGLETLHRALDRARDAAEGDQDAEAALERFRAELSAEWAYLEGVRQLCSTDAQRRSLDALERLRYAEEHAVRREAASLAALRRQVASDIAP